PHACRPDDTALLAAFARTRAGQRQRASRAVLHALGRGRRAGAKDLLPGTLKAADKSFTKLRTCARLRPRGAVGRIVFCAKHLSRSAPDSWLRAAPSFRGEEWSRKCDRRGCTSRESRCA